MERVALYPTHHKISYSCFIWVFGLGLFLFLILHNILNNHYETFYQFNIMNHSTQFLNTFFFFRIEHNRSDIELSRGNMLNEDEKTFLKKIFLMKNKNKK